MLVVGHAVHDAPGIVLQKNSTPMTISKKISRGMKISGGLVAVGVVAGAFLGKMLPGFGNGGGAGPAPKDRVTDSPETETKPPPKSKPEQISPDALSDVLYVSIQGRGYRILGKDGKTEESRAATLEQVVELARATTGDENGIRVRVTRDASARAKTEDDLLQELTGAGLAKESIIGLEETAPGIR